MATFACVIEVQDEVWENVLSLAKQRPEVFVGEAVSEALAKLLFMEFDFDGPIAVTVNGWRTVHVREA